MFAKTAARLANKVGSVAIEHLPVAWIPPMKSLITFQEQKVSGNPRSTI